MEPTRKAEAEPSAAVRRILVALEPSPHGRAALSEAMALAARLHAEIVALFVEDEELLRCARLPFVREFTTIEAGGRALDVGAMERSLRAQAVAMRSELEREAGRSRVKWSFRVARGSVAAEVVSAGEEADLIVVGRAQAGVAKVRMGSTARAVISRSRRTVFCTRRVGAARADVMLLCDGSDASVRAVRTALDFALTESACVHVAVVPPETPDAAAERLRGIVGELPSALRFFPLDDASLDAVASAAASLDVRAVVLAEGALGTSAERMSELVDAIDRPVVVVR